MNKTLYSLILTSLLLIIGTSACNLSAAQTPQISTLSPTVTAIPVIAPTQSDTPIPPTPEFAPFCKPGDTTNIPTPSSCRLPIAEAGSSFCNKKVPYNLIYINAGATYEVLTPGFRCSDEGMKDNRQLLTCIGPMASNFGVSVCDPACAVPTIPANITQCPPDFNYNDLQGCCTQEPKQINQNCVTLSIESTTCVVNCREFRKRSECNHNFYACEWDNASKVCRSR
jgi:hypothetical protein